MREEVAQLCCHDSVDDGLTVAFPFLLAFQDAADVPVEPDQLGVLRKDDPDPGIAGFAL